MPTENRKPLRTFPTLQRLTVEDFDLAQEPNDDPTQIDGTAPPIWHLLLGGKTMFRLPAIPDIGEDDARTLFQWMLDRHHSGICIGYDHGKKQAQHDIRSAIGVPHPARRHDGGPGMTDLRPVHWPSPNPHQKGYTACGVLMRAHVVTTDLPHHLTCATCQRIASRATQEQIAQKEE